MSRTHSSNPERQEKFTYRTTLERGRRIKQRSIDLGATYEETIDLAVDRYFREVRTANAYTPHNQMELTYSERLIRFLRDPKAQPGYRRVLEFLLTEYQ